MYCKICNKEFEPDKNRKRKTCQKCISKQKNNNRKNKCLEYKGNCCQICGYNRNSRALHFHHIDKKTKIFKISAGSYKWEKLQPELDKCVLICANCHGEVHEGIINLFDFINITQKVDDTRIDSA